MPLSEHVKPPYQFRSHTCAFRTIVIAVILSAIGIAEESWSGEAGFAPEPIFHLQKIGAEFVASGVTTRQTSMTIPQSNPFALAVPTIPPFGFRDSIFLTWCYLVDSTPPAVDTILVDGVPVIGGSAASGSPDLCHQKDYGVAFLANITSIFPTTLPQMLIITNATDKPLGFDTLAYGNGMSLVIVYHNSSSPRTRVVDLFYGYMSTQSGPVGNQVNAGLGLTLRHSGPRCHFFANGIDGQGAGDFFQLKGINRGGQIAGTNSASDALIGFLGPQTNANFYDHIDDTIHQWLSIPEDSIKYRLIANGDCVGTSIAVVSYECCQSLRGNFDYSAGDAINIIDVTYIVNYLFKLGPKPPCDDEGDITGDRMINLLDLIYLINYMFKGGPIPPACP